MQLQVAKVAVGCNATLPYKIKKFTHTLFKGEISMKKPEDSAWELFEKTGKTGYYMLYKKLKRQSGDRQN